MKKIKIITEEVFVDSKVDIENRIIKNAAVLGSYSGNAGGREYTDTALESAVEVLEGKPCYINHIVTRNGKTRNVKELAGQWSGLHVANKKVRGNLKVLEKEAWLLEVAKEMPTVAGFSIDAIAKYRRKPRGGEVIESLVSGTSIDFVGNPATNKSIFESKEDNEVTDEQIKALQESVKALKENQDKLQVASIAKEKAQEEQIQKLTEENDALKLAKETEKTVKKLLEEAKLPEYACTELFQQQLMSAKDEDAQKALIKGQKDLIENARKTPRINNNFSNKGSGDSKNLTDKQVAKKLMEELSA